MTSTGSCAPRCTSVLDATTRPELRSTRYEIVVVRGAAHRIVPRQENRHLAALRQQDDVGRLRPQTEDVRRAMLCWTMQMPLAPMPATTGPSTPEST